MTIPRFTTARRPTRIVKLIDDAKSTDAAHGCSTLLKGEEAAILAPHPPGGLVVGAPSSIIAGQVIFTASPLPISFIAEIILCRGDAGPQKRRACQHYQCKLFHLDLTRRNLTLALLARHWPMVQLRESLNQKSKIQTTRILDATF